MWCVRVCAPPPLPASFLMEGVLAFLVSPDPEAAALRDAFEFHVFPMVGCGCSPCCTLPVPSGCGLRSHAAGNQRRLVLLHTPPPSIN